MCNTYCLFRLQMLYLLIYNRESFSKMTAAGAQLSEIGCLVEDMRSFIIVSGSTCSVCCYVVTWVVGSLAVTLRPTGWQNWNFTKLFLIMSTYKDNIRNKIRTWTIRTHKDSHIISLSELFFGNLFCLTIRNSCKKQEWAGSSNIIACAIRFAAEYCAHTQLVYSGTLRTCTVNLQHRRA